jgi:phosphopantothenoylcysteine decarboxylase / phosphopantothenate---cysteine ligase
MMLDNRKVLLAVTGSIAAYKAAYLVRLLVQHGAQVKVVLSPGALEFITPLTFSTLSKNPVYSDFTENKDSGVWNHHVELALWADLIIVAPASANTLSKMANGQSDNFLLATYMSARSHVMIAPAMDHDMFLHGGTRENLRKLKDFGHQILAPGQGELASGLVGTGRMAEPQEILDAVIDHFHPALPLKGQKVLVTAGPTYEKLDPVRFIGNYSSGKMGYALATALANKGAQVHLVIGPNHLSIQHPGIVVHPVESANDMLEACLSQFEHCNLTILSAAVADYRPAHQASEKIKKQGDGLTVELVKNPDIAATLGQRKKGFQKIVGFALETTNEKEYAAEKLRKKNLDLIVLNSLRNEGAGFGTDTNQISLIWPDNISHDFGLMSKQKVAEIIVDAAIDLLNKP